MTPLFKSRVAAFGCLAACLVVLVLAQALAWLVQTDFGKVAVRNEAFLNENGQHMRAKLLYPRDGVNLPGIVYVHGYQNNRETSDPYAIELARRGFAVLEIDAIGRGNSDPSLYMEDAAYDPTFGTKSALAHLRSLGMVDSSRVGLMGHSLGAEMAYGVALADPGVNALAFSGFAYTDQAGADQPRNMLMIFGRYDEYRQRMTGTRDFDAEWLSSERTRRVIPVENPQFGVTYGDFAAGSARRVYMPAVTHVQESHSEAAVAEALEWMRRGLHPDSRYWVDSARQTWPVKEAATLVAMLCGLAALLPLGWLLLRWRPFAALRGAPRGDYASRGRAFWLPLVWNGLLTWLYLPLVLVLFAIHIYVVRIDKVFPMMMANGIIFWFVVVNLIGFFLFRAWANRQNRASGLSLYDLGVSHRPGGFALDGKRLLRSAGLALLLFLVAYLLEAVLERIFIADYRFVFPFASDMTPYRWGMWLLYFPFLLAGFVMNGMFLHGQLRAAPGASGARSFWVGWARSAVVMILPLVTILLAQYLPLFTVGVIPFVGPGAALVGFVINLFPIMLKLLVATAFSTWFYQETGDIYTGAILNAAIIAWMFASSQVIAPVPV